MYEKRKVEGGIEHSLISSFRFVTYMANYSNELFDFAYSAERSIEDGIQELSDAEMSTVIISYVVMFVYITIALGKFKGFRHLLVSGGFSQMNFKVRYYGGNVLTKTYLIEMMIG